jgi:hypothetical protein
MKLFWPRRPALNKAEQTVRGNAMAAESLREMACRLLVQADTDRDDKIFWDHVGKDNLDDDAEKLTVAEWNQFVVDVWDEFRIWNGMADFIQDLFDEWMVRTGRRDSGD